MHMLIKRLITALVFAALLAGCASNPTQPGRTDVRMEDLCRGSGLGDMNGNLGGDPVIVLAVVAVVVGVLVYQYVDCKLLLASGQNKTSSVRNDVYQSGDKVFSVALPQAPDDGMDILQAIEPQHDYVFFRPVRSKDIYAISVAPTAIKDSKPETLDEFAAHSLQNDEALHFGKSIYLSAYTLLHRENLVLRSSPVVFELFTHTGDSFTEYERDQFPDAKQLYYLTYFTQVGSHSAALIIAWPYACPKCVGGDEADIRATDPCIQRFVESFQLSAASSAN